MCNAWAAISPNHGNSHCVQMTLAVPIAVPVSIAMLCRISVGRWLPVAGARTPDCPPNPGAHAKIGPIPA
jgi:hypothetical protein